MTVIFHNEISVASINELIEKLQPWDEVDLWFSSEGGETLAMEAFIHYLNSRRGITIHYTHTCDSCTVMLWYGFRGTQVLAHNFMCSYLHNIDALVFTNRSKHVVQYSRQADDVRRINKIFLKKLRGIGVKKEVIETVESGGEVILWRDDVKKLAPFSGAG